MVFVTDYMAVGNSQDVLASKESKLREMGITGVLNVAFDLECPEYNTIEAHHCGLIAGPGNKVDSFRFAVDTGYRMLSSHESIIVHCHAGRERSPLVAAGIMCRRSQYERPFISCYKFIKEQLYKGGAPAAWDTEGAKQHLPKLAEQWYEMARNRLFTDAKSAKMTYKRDEVQ